MTSALCQSPWALTISLEAERRGTQHRTQPTRAGRPSPRRTRPTRHHTTRTHREKATCNPPPALHSAAFTSLLLAAPQQFIFLPCGKETDSFILCTASAPVGSDDLARGRAARNPTSSFKYARGQSRLQANTPDADACFQDPPRKGNFAIYPL